MERCRTLDAREAASMLGVDHRTVRRLCEQGKIPAVDVSTKRGRHVWRIPRDRFERYVEGERI